MKKLLALSVMTVLLLASHAGGQTQVSPEEYEVYSALIREKYIKEGVKLVVIAGPTYSPVPGRVSAAEFFAEWVKRLPALSAETCDDFVAQNGKGEQIVDRSFTLGVDYIVVDYDAIEGLFAFGADLEEAWKEFYGKYPRSNGYIRVSRVGFNRAKDQALVQMSWMCDRRCGEGKYVLLVRRDGKWKVEGKAMVWAS